MPLPRLTTYHADNTARFINEIGELVEFAPFGGEKREIYAKIERLPSEAGQNGTRSRPVIYATFVNSEPAGISPATLDFSRSKINVAYFEGGERQEFGFTRTITAQTPGRWRVKLV